ncbi:cell cycle checkpoint control protein RAD9A-like [Dendronephthya gigantea]|uniref:cell cycle checkpoint control protein RAD9A-like n=1 Tax=Dendronephthya gigantea TaxID=151771 RepID=UPI00106D3B6F|nr:cell cycle checkpoint control protein RAD9A-like [Dendronephthya gigantea]
MRCVLVGDAVKLFARSIHCLAKIGDEIYIEPLKKGLSLRTVNSSRSAYACCLFTKSFFLTYDESISNHQSQDSLDEDFKCKLSMKSCLTVFKSLNTVDRVVDQCTIKIDDDLEQLTFLLYCRHGITKTYNLSYQDCESLQAIFTKDLTPNVVNVQPNILNDVVTNFQNAHEEITFAVCPQNLVVTNYVDESEDPYAVIKTKMVLAAEEFDKFQIGVDTEVTFCLKELKGIITFADWTKENLDIHFESAGKPIVFSLVNDPTFEANFVLATLMDLQDEETLELSNKPVSKKANKTSENPKKKQPGNQRTNEKERTVEKPSKHLVKSQPKLDQDEFGFDDDDDWTKEAIAIEKNLTQERSRSSGKKHPNFEDSLPSTSTEVQRNLMVKQKQSVELSALPSGLLDSENSLTVDSLKSPGIRVRSGKNKTMQLEDRGQEPHDLVNASQESVPGTPPNKKFKSMFFSAITSKTTSKEKSKSTSVVLVKDSDDESD